MGASGKRIIVIGVILGSIVVGVILLKKMKDERSMVGGIDQHGSASSGHSSSEPSNVNSGAGNSGAGNPGAAQNDSNAPEAAGQGPANANADSDSENSIGSTNSQPETSTNSGASGRSNGMESQVPGSGTAPNMLPSENDGPKSSALGKPLVNLKSGSAQNIDHSGGKQAGQNVATTNPSKISGGNNQMTPKSDVPTVKERPNFPGIVQVENGVMVSDVRYKGGEGADQIIVTLTQVEGNGKKSGKIWVIGEYIQRGTTGIMFMPSHNELKLAADGTPKNAKTGIGYDLKTAVTTAITVPKPGFEGEELTGVRIGVVDSVSGQVHYAKISMKHIQKRPVIKRVKVSADDANKRKP